MWTILSLPAAHHPRLKPMIEHMASLPQISVEDALDLIAAACMDAKITGLDIDMVQPGAQIAVPFTPATNATPSEQFDDGVRHQVHRLIQGGRP